MMPENPSFQDTPGKGHLRKVQSRSSSPSRNDGSCPEEGPTRRRLQKHSSTSFLSEASSHSSKSIAATRTSVMNRRRLSIRDQKAPQGPRPQDPSRTSNTSGSFFHSGNSSIDSTNDSTQSNNSRISLRSTSVGNLAKPDYNQMPSQSTDFLPSVNFDDMQNSIVGESQLKYFPVPGTTGSGYEPGWANGSTNGEGTRSRSNSIRRKSVVNSSSESVSSRPSATSTTTGRNRRQSLAQQAGPNGTASRAPRKSIGPASLPSIVTGRRQSLSARKASADTTRTEQTSYLRPRTQQFDLSRTEGTKLSSNARSIKAKSLQPPLREPDDKYLTASGPAEYSRSSSTNAVRTPVKNAAAAPNTPASSCKRVSVMPPHVHGLGARTISPTDARRAKRMSTAPSAHPTPFTPPTQTEPMPVRPRSTAQSPSHIPRKSVTPSSNRTTPDPNRKSYSSGLSLSSTTTYNSVRNSAGSLQNRLSHSSSTSRLPTPKTRSEPNPPDEEVPPVPAIPKAYESPKGDFEPPNYVTPRKPSLNMETGSKPKFESEPDNNLTATISTEDDAPKTREGRAMKTPEAKPRTSALLGKRNLQPLKLPPLNLLPLGTPMTTKIEALRDRDDDLTVHTPSAQIASKTPSTPLTASKANFFSTVEDDDLLAVTQARSSTSHFALSTSSTASALRTVSGSSALAGFDNTPTNARTMSPYVAYSLPKSNSEHTGLKQKVSDDYSPKAIQSYKMAGPRPQTQSSAFSSNAETISQLSTPSDPENNSISSSSLRNKITMTRKRSSSKTQTGGEASSDPVKHDPMPPPKIPTSSTWNNLTSIKTSSPTLKPSYLKSRRQASVSKASGQTLRKPSFSSEQSLALEPSPSNDSNDSDPPVPQHRTASSIFSPVHRIISSAKSSVASTPAPPPTSDPNVDPDVRVADEEMRKLGSKRKDFETAAKNLDDLRRKASPKERVSPAQALRIANLNIFERGEIIDFKDIFFCGTQNAKKHVGDLSVQANFGYDDDRGDYNIVIGDHLAYRYEVIDVLGKGSFGQVVRCIDHKTGGLVAVKIIRNKKRFHQQALIEVNLLQKLKEWDPQRRHNVVNFTQSFYFRGHLCISTELLGMNLYEFIKAHDFKGFSLKLIRRFTKQMLNTLVLLQAKKVIHCDLKPENILLCHPLSSDIRVIDFGSSCFENEKVYTYIQSRFYRSPEVILGMSYGMPIDMWSVGCILAELFTGYPIFPGENEQEQLACIMEVFGPPEKHLIEKSTRKKLFFDSLGKPRLTVSSKGRRRRPSSKELRQVLKCDDEAFLDFISRCLRWDPARRMSPQDALRHEFITGIKLASRPRQYTLTNNSPAKRVISSNPSLGRPLPEPPVAGLKGGTLARTRDASGTSPVKPAGKRHSTVSGLPPSTPAKRNTSISTGTPGSALPRVAARSISGKPDLATAAAVTSLRTK
ncbi:protein kinase [Aspergillus japonicus CBS 114.51]|uniref:Protein kinase n=1 Tax=Aspergillus japonicus CBS 114.51 TaxID=1448312 RepID=A0A8T8X133_ASPJA|nr:protein kinase [Aspergillus japonicus CBS 114.51]RAH81803.1 protein kinase [Aspergillus japonicus CBS 114.51]